MSSQIHVRNCVNLKLWLRVVDLERTKPTFQGQAIL